jgi:hypothetical protein
MFVKNKGFVSSYTFKAGGGRSIFSTVDVRFFIGLKKGELGVLLGVSSKGLMLSPLFFSNSLGLQGTVLLLCLTYDIL